MNHHGDIIGDRGFTKDIENASASYIQIEQSIFKIKKNSFQIVSGIIIGVIFALFAYNSAMQRDIQNRQTRANIVLSTLSDGIYFSFWIVGSWIIFYQFTTIVGNLFLANIKDEYLNASFELLKTIQSVDSLDELDFLYQQLIGIPHLDNQSVENFKQAIYIQSVKLTN